MGRTAGESAGDGVRPRHAALHGVGTVAQRGWRRTFRDREPARGCPYRRCAGYLMQYEVIVIDEQRRHGFHRR